MKINYRMKSGRILFMIFCFLQILMLTAKAAGNDKSFQQGASKKPAQEILRILPLKIGDFIAEGSITVYDEEGMGASLGYNSETTFGSELTVYIYDLGEKRIADGADSEVILKAKESALGEMKSLETEYMMYRNLKILSDEKINLSLDKNRTLKAVYMSFSFELLDPLGGASLGGRSSYTYITGLKGYICKIRATVPTADKEKEIQEAVKTIFSSLF
jgi:hypothetical protein